MSIARRSWLKGGAALGLGLSLGTPARAATSLYRRGNDADPETLDPHKTSTVAEAHLLRDLYEGLLTYDNHGRMIPGAAASWTVSEDRLTYTFTLRADGRWSNGDPVTAEDFVFGLRRILDPKTAAKYAEVVYPIRGAAAVNRGEAGPETLGVAALDAATVVVTLAEPVPYLLELLTHQTSLPVHRPSVAQYGDAFTRPGRLVTNGPYALVDMVPNDRITLRKNPHFRDAGTIAISEVAFIPTPDLSSAVRRYAAGEIDSLSDLPADQMPSLKARFGDQVQLSPALGLLAIAVNTRKKPFDDIRVRRALSLVIDREFLAQAVWGDTMAPAYSLCPPGLDNYRDPPELAGRETLPIDREEEARALLAEAGYGPGKAPLTLEYRFNTTDNNRNTAIALADFWRGIGIETRFVNTDAKTHFAYLRDGGDFDLARMSWYADYSDPQNFLFLLRTGNVGFNAGHWSNAAYDGLLNQAAAEREVGKRADMLFQAERIVVSELPWIPVLHYRSKALVSPRLHGIHPNLRNVAPTRFLSLS
ncbi:peptide ABC transporter substrate-binding protein [Methylobacterium brachythecii]|uniref:ABC transporter substrate-binding protein n=1 Tax=Methylobacterium brachythecii TaxID=1176177 RepID=A0A7W6F506_9HYPH|nr:peptide ABC transporter substrate-binding protein [Methylobacterium brachythecii]MBB3900847.1 oligopeptide transport system substrate-binding protein [Methylobacterium brachythecii]GLS46069.1 ABC transporter substrate-binding protein [Methylobacterium brachythecii]